MTKAARLSRAGLRRAIKVAEAAGKCLAVRPDGTLIFEDKASEVVPSAAEWLDWNKPREDVSL